MTGSVDNSGREPPDPSALSGALLEAAPDGTVVVDDEGRIVLINSQTEVIFGYERSHLIGNPVEVLLLGAQRDVHQLHRQRFGSSPRTRPMGVGVQLLGRHRDGYEIPIEISLSPISVDGQAFTIASVRDVTEQRRLQAEREQIQTALDASLDGLYLLDELLRIRYANRGATQQSGHDVDALLGTSLEDLLARGPGEPPLAEALSPLRDGTRDHVIVSTRLARTDGRVLNVEAVLQRAPNPTFANYLGLIRDIGSRIESERTLRRANEALLLADERERIARDLHDNVIQRLYASGLALQSTLSSLPDAGQQRIETVIDGIDTTITELRHAIFELNRHATDPNTFERELRKVVRDAERGLGFAPSLSVAMSGDLMAGIAADVLAVLREALANAVRHARSTEVSVAVVCGPIEARLTVEDDGVGVSPSALRGSGLDNINARAQALNGECSIGSRQGGGTRLDWRVPLPPLQIH